MIFYILDENKNVIPTDQEGWGNYFYPIDNRIVAQDEINSSSVSTVFLGIDPNFLQDGPPLLFETMIFNNSNLEKYIYCERYSTWKEAEEGHKKAIK